MKKCVEERLVPLLFFFILSLQGIKFSISVEIITLSFFLQKNHDMYHDVTIFSIFNFYNYFHKGSYFMIDKLL